MATVLMVPKNKASTITFFRVVVLKCTESILVTSVSIIGFDVLLNQVICAYLLTDFTFTQIGRFVMPQKGPLLYDYTQKPDWSLYSKVREPSHFI